MIHKRELSDSMIESGSSLFYLLHCSVRDNKNLPSASKHPRTDCIGTHMARMQGFGTLPQHIPHGLHLAATTTAPVAAPLPQHIPHGLHQQNCTDAMPQIHAICCELVDSFSDATKTASALTIFPRSSTVKAIYIAISDSLGRTIDRFWGANRTEKVC